MPHHHGDLNSYYRCAAGFCRWWLGQLYRARWFGVEHVPPTGGCLVASNHVSYYDPPLIGGGVPRALYYFARKTLMAHPVGAWLLPRINTIPVDRDGPADVTALKRVIGLVQNGAGLVVFPEGTRSPDGELQPGKPGVGFLALKLRVPVVPVRIFGAHQIWPRERKLPYLHGRVDTVFGAPIRPEEFPAARGKEAQLEAAQLIMDRIATLRRPAGDAG